MSANMENISKYITMSKHIDTLFKFIDTLNKTDDIIFLHMLRKRMTEDAERNNEREVEEDEDEDELTPDEVDEILDSGDFQEFSKEEDEYIRKDDRFVKYFNDNYEYNNEVSYEDVFEVMVQFVKDAGFKTAVVKNDILKWYSQS